MMKKYLLVFVALVMGVAAWGQSAPKHLKFKDLPIDGTQEEFVRKLGRIGFTFVQVNSEGTMLVGSFAEYPECEVAVFTPRGVREVSSVGVVFPTRTSWADLQRDYNALKGILIRKYGTPDKVTEQFFGGARPSSDDEKLNCVKSDQCMYATSFDIEEGDILLQMGHDNHGDCYVTLGYRDKKNAENSSDWPPTEERAANPRTAR